MNRRRALLVDSGIALAVASFDLYAAAQPWDDGTRIGPYALNAPLVTIVVLPLALRRVRPALGLWLMWAAFAIPSAIIAHDTLFWGGFLPLLVMVFAAARGGDGIAGRLSWLVPISLMPVGAIHTRASFSLGNAAFLLVGGVAAWAIGRIRRRQERQEQRIAAALAELSAGGDARERAVVGAERVRIAGEMHDVVAHAVSLMTLQVGAARLEVEAARSSSSAVEQLRTAEDTGRAALDELRRSLQILRRPTS